jgi:hypothetical protein
MPGVTDILTPAETPSETADRITEDKRIGAEERAVNTDMPVDDEKAMAVVDGDAARGGSYVTEP